MDALFYAVRLSNKDKSPGLDGLPDPPEDCSIMDGRADVQDAIEYFTAFGFGSHYRKRFTTAAITPFDRRHHTLRITLLAKIQNFILNNV